MFRTQKRIKALEKAVETLAERIGDWADTCDKDGIEIEGNYPPIIDQVRALADKLGVRITVATVPKDKK